METGNWQKVGMVDEQEKKGSVEKKVDCQRLQGDFFFVLGRVFFKWTNGRNWWEYGQNCNNIKKKKDFLKSSYGRILLPILDYRQM